MDIGGQFEGEGDGQFRGPGRVYRGQGSLISIELLAHASCFQWHTK